MDVDEVPELGMKTLGFSAGAAGAGISGLGNASGLGSAF